MTAARTARLLALVLLAAAAVACLLSGATAAAGTLAGLTAVGAAVAVLAPGGRTRPATSAVPAPEAAPDADLATTLTL
jgi:hypothetical protein